MSKTKEYICFPGLIKQKPWCNVFGVHVHAIPSSPFNQLENQSVCFCVFININNDD